MDGAPAPDLINWENLKVSLTERVIRWLITTTLSFFLLLATCGIIYLFKQYENEARAFSPPIDCTPFQGDDVITMDMAYIDQQRKEDERQGLMHCFCLDALHHLKPMSELVFQDGQLYCETWFSNYVKSNALLITLSISISLINTFVKEILRCKVFRFMLSRRLKV